MEVRYMSPADDRVEISKIYEESWKFAYRGILPQNYLDSISQGRWVSNLDEQGRKTLVCIDEGRMVGVCSFCKSRLERLQGWGEIISIYLFPEYIGKGYGKILMKTALSELKKRGYENVFLWVLEENIRARNFYERFGFLPIDDFSDDNIGGKELRKVRYIYKNKEKQ